MTTGWRVPLAVSAVGALVAGTAIVRLTESDRAIEHSFATALGEHGPRADGLDRSDGAYFQLSSLTAPAKMGPVSATIGERFAIDGPGGQRVGYEVVDVRPLKNGESGYGNRTSALLVVTAHPVGSTTDDGVLRFLVEDHSALATGAGAKPRAL